MLSPWFLSQIFKQRFPQCKSSITKIYPFTVTGGNSVRKKVLRLLVIQRSRVQFLTTSYLLRRILKKKIYPFTKILYINLIKNENGVKHLQGELLGVISSYMCVCVAATTIFLQLMPNFILLHSNDLRVPNKITYGHKSQRPVLAENLQMQD